MIDVPATGRCQCGQLGYAVGAQPFVAYTCHCRECQRLSSSAFATCMQVPAEAVEMTAGVAHTRTRPSDSGNEISMWLCASCGFAVFLQNSSRPRVRTVLVGTLEHLEQVQVDAHIWLKRKLPWVVIPAAHRQFDGAGDWSDDYAHDPDQLLPSKQSEITRDDA